MATVNMPQLGESVFEGTIGKWLVSVGDHVKKDQAIVEVLTDKADSELPAPEEGVITKLLAKEGDTVQVGQELCEIDPNASAGVSKSAGTSKSANNNKSNESAAPQATSKTSSQPQANSINASPAVRKEAREKGIDLQQLAGSGAGGRITKDDIAKAVSVSGTGHSAQRASSAPERQKTLTGPPALTSSPATSATGRKLAFQPPPYVPRPGDEVVPYSRRRRIIADHMVYSKQNSPQVVTVAECDLKKTAKVRDTHKKQLKAEGINLTYLAFVSAAVTRALREHRELNSRVLDDAYVLLRDIHLGIAVDTPEGLVVPVIKHADELSVRGLARGIDEIAAKARDGNLSPDDLAGKTFTISNPGRKGNLYGGAIISQPNVGILRIGEIQKRVVVVEEDGEDRMAIHPVMYMALTYDHRVVDGVAANGFLYRIVEILEAGDFEI